MNNEEVKTPDTKEILPNKGCESTYSVKPLSNYLGFSEDQTTKLI